MLWWAVEGLGWKAIASHFILYYNSIELLSMPLAVLVGTQISAAPLSNPLQGHIPEVSGPTASQSLMGQLSDATHTLDMP